MSVDVTTAWRSDFIGRNTLSWGDGASSNLSSSAAAYTNLWRAAQEESVRRLGYGMWGVQVDEGTDAMYHFWYFAMPEDLQNGDTDILNDYASNAMERRAALMGERLGDPEL